MIGTGGSYGGVIKEIQSWMDSFTPCTYAYVNRRSNYEGHHLARHSLFLGQGRHIVRVIPMILCSIITLIMSCE